MAPWKGGLQGRGWDSRRAARTKLRSLSLKVISISCPRKPRSIAIAEQVKRTLSLVTLGLSAAFRLSIAETLRVPSQYPTVQAAVDAAESGDTVLIASGIYEERVTVDVSRLTIAAEAIGGAIVRNNGRVISISADSCSVTGLAVENTARVSGAITLSLSGRSTLVESCDLSSGYAVVAIADGGCTLRSCVISDGVVGISIEQGGDVTLENCDLVGNISENVGGGIFVGANPGGDPSEVLASECRFVGNFADLAGGGVAVDASVGPEHAIVLDKCVFVNNTSRIGAAVWSINADLALQSCTIASNTILLNSVDGGVVDLEGASPVMLSIERCVIALNDGPALRCSSTVSPTVSCTDVFGNASDEICGIDGGDNFSLDPLFCNVGARFLALSAESPCAPDHSPGSCGLIGALSPSCVSAVSASTWGAIKERYERSRR